MQTRRIIIAVIGVAVLALVVLLLLESRGGKANTLSADKKARALAEYERRSRLNEAPEPAADEPRVRRPRRVEPAAPDEAETEVEPVAPKPMRRQPALASTIKASQLAPAITSSNGADDEVKKATEEVRQSYDTGNYVEAQKLSLAAVQKSPRNIKILRYVVSSSCAVGEVETAREYAERLPKRDRDQMAKRCQQNWGAEL